MKRVLMEITIDADGLLQWSFDPDLSVVNMYAVYGLLDLIRQELAEELREDFSKK